MTVKITTPDLQELCKAELELCAVREEETIAILMEGATRADYASAFSAAAASLGASSFELRLPRAGGNVTNDAGVWTVGTTGLAGNRGALAALEQADIIVDLVFLLFSDEQLALQAAGRRIITCVEPVDALARLFPSRELRRRCEVAGELLTTARALRFTNDHGTDVDYRIGVLPTMVEYGYTDLPGRWDHWPSGFVFTAGADDGVDGRVVLAPGDIIFPFKCYVREPVEFAIEHGQIVEIRGGLEAQLLRDYMAAFEDPDAYGISHIGWGLNQNARWSSLATDQRGMGMESRAFYGNVLFSTGPNHELGGSNRSPCHIDMPMRGCSVYLDDEPIVEEGRIVVSDMRAEVPA